MSKLSTNEIIPVTGTTVTLGESGDTISVPSGATIANSGTATGFMPAVGASGNVLTSDGTNWASQAAAGGGAWNLIGTAVASNSASLTITGLDSTYGQYAIGLSDFTSSGDNQYLEMQVGDSSGIHSGGSDYEHMSMVPVPTNNSGGYFSSSGNSAMRLLQNTGSSAGEGSGGLIYLNRPANGTSYPHFAGSVSSVNRHGNCAGGTFAGIRKAAVAVDRILVKFDSGNIVTGRMTIWGIAHT